MAKRGTKRKWGSENGQQDPNKRPGQQGELVEDGTGAQPGGEQGPSQLTANGGLQRQDQRWVCPFCNAVIGCKYYLPVHVRRDHEGFETSRGEAMTRYLQGMSRWLCGKCHRTTSLKRKYCSNAKCRESRVNRIPGQATAGPSFRWPNPEGEQRTDAASGEEAMATETQDSSGIPNFDQVFSICGPLAKYVPKSCRDLWAEIIYKELNDVESCNNNLAWTRLFMVAKCCLWEPHRTRGGRKRHKKERGPLRIMGRLERWKCGDITTLWKEYVDSCQERRMQGQGDQDVASVRRARRLASEGRYARACQALTSLGVHRLTDPIKERLHSLHPSSPALGEQSDELPEAYCIDKKAVLAALQSFPKDTAPGASLMTPQHLKDAIMCKSPVLRTRVENALTSIVNLLASGEANRETAPFMAGGGLTPLSKPDNNVRPIMVRKSYVD